MPVAPTTIAVSSGATSAMRLASPRPTAAIATSTCAPLAFSAVTSVFTASAGASNVTPSSGAPTSDLSGCATPMNPTFTPSISRTSDA